MNREAAKRRAGESAAEAVEDGDVVGLGTGSTAAYAIRRLGQRVDSGLDIHGIPTSFQSRMLARDAGVPLTSLDESLPDIAIDGADQVANGNLIKGGGGAHAREKVVATAADQFLVIIDPSKESKHLDKPVPVELLPSAREPVRSHLEALGGEPTLRMATEKDGPVITDNGNVLIDCAFDTITSPAELATEIDSIPGVVAHGLFIGVADEIHLGTPESVEVRRCESEYTEPSQ